MPNRNGAGPLGLGPGSGRGRGFCPDRETAGKAQGFGLGRGKGRGILCRRASEEERLKEENDRLERSLARLRRRRENFRGE